MYSSLLKMLNSTLDSFHFDAKVIHGKTDRRSRMGHRAASAGPRRHPVRLRACRRR